ncbi:hypothetical protein FACS1894216_11750 [Synergistales bacterium]|nr:hypothetical protein FACS1894216_11750 [Synergistales bacterium]
MSEDKNSLPDNKKGEQDTLSKVLTLVPLIELILHIVEFLLDLWK